MYRSLIFFLIWLYQHIDI